MSDQKTLRALLEQAASDLDIYKHPDIDAAKVRQVMALLVANGLMSSNPVNPPKAP